MKIITFVLWDEESDGVIIREWDDDTGYKAEWRENSFGYLDQWLRFCAPLNQPVILEIEPG